MPKCFIIIQTDQEAEEKQKKKKPLQFVLQNRVLLEVWGKTPQQQRWTPEGVFKSKPGDVVRNTGVGPIHSTPSQTALEAPTWQQAWPALGQTPSLHRCLP